MIKKLTFATNRRPTPERVREAVEATRRKAIEKQYLKLAKYCQRCGKKVYPDSSGSYPLSEVVDKKLETPLLVCADCKDES